MNQPSIIEINWRDNADLQAALGAKKAGDKVPSIELKDLVVKEQTSEGIKLTYSKIAVEGYEPGDAKDIDTGSQSEMSPASIVLRAPETAT